MKIKPSKKPGKVLMEVGRKDTSILSTPSPFSIRRILVPVDFSECSDKAVAYAKAFAKQFQAQLSLIHVVELSYSYTDVAVFDYTALERDLRAGAENRLKEIANACLKDGVQASAEVLLGRPARVIADEARKRGTDLIIISTHGYTGLKHVLLGSTAENVVRYASCPVLVLRQNEHEFLKG
jgi:universal stress protein A